MTQVSVTRKLRQFYFWLRPNNFTHLDSLLGISIMIWIKMRLEDGITLTSSKWFYITTRYNLLSVGLWNFSIIGQTNIVKFKYSEKATKFCDIHRRFVQGIQIWTENSILKFENLKPVEKSRNHFSIIWTSSKVVLIFKIRRVRLKN